MMIGGGGSSCRRADHGIGITENGNAVFGSHGCYADFGDHCTYPTSYSLNMWIK